MSTLDEQVRSYFTALHGDEHAAETRNYPLVTPHRRRTRRHVAWAIVAATLVLVVGTAVLLTRGTEDSGRFVDTGQTEARPGPPWLGPSSPADLGMVDTWRSGSLLSWTRPAFEPGTDGAGWLVEVSVVDGPLEFEPEEGVGPPKPTVIDGRPALFVQLDERRMLRIERADGWLLVLTANRVVEPAAASDSLDAALVRLAEDLSVRPPAFWLPQIDQGMRNGEDQPRPGYRLGLAGDDGSTFAQDLVGTSVTKALVLPGYPINTFQLSSARTGSGTPSTLSSGEAMTVRGTAGTLATLEDIYGDPHHVLSWFEDGFQHQLYATTDVPVDEIVAVAEGLRLLDWSDWEQAVFPDSTPSGLVDLHW